MDDTLEQLNNFVAMQSLKMPQLISKEMFIEAEIYDDYILCQFRLPQSITLEELTDELDDQIELVLLYSHIPTDDTLYARNCCAYSNPDFERMYKINAVADDNNNVENIMVTIYDSLEVMCVELREELRIKSQQGRFDFAITDSALLQSFI